jgi:hypothetical protein
MSGHPTGQKISTTAVVFGSDKSSEVCMVSGIPFRHLPISHGKDGEHLRNLMEAGYFGGEGNGVIEKLEGVKEC